MSQQKKNNCDIYNVHMSRTTGLVVGGLRRVIDWAVCMLVVAFE